MKAPRDSSKRFKDTSFRVSTIEEFLGEIEGRRIFFCRNTMPNLYDIVFTPTDNQGTPGQLNRIVLENLGYSIKDLYTITTLKKGYGWLEHRELKPIVLIVTINFRLNTEVLLFDNLVLAFIEYEERFWNQRLWIPLMGTGSGGISHKQSLQATLNAIISWNKKKPGNFQCEIYLSLPPGATDKEIDGLRKLVQKMISYSSTQEENQKSKEMLAEPEKIPIQQTERKIVLNIEPADEVPITLDNPAIIDQLGHKDYAKSIARHIRRIWPELEPNKITDRKGTDEENDYDQSWLKAFMLHIYGPWGSGKSSLLNFLKDELQSVASNGGKKWVVIEFNAWQHQHIDPPWWPLITSIFKQSREQLWKNFGYKEKIRSIWIWIKVHLFRLFFGREHLPLTFAILFLSIFLVLLIFPSINTIFRLITQGDTLEKILKGITSILGITALVWTLGKKISLSFVHASSCAAQSFLQFASDSMNSISNYFKRMVATIKVPVAIFIDDLDRCKPLYVVRFLEGIQTLFRNNRILYVVAADRKWISICFEECYKEFSGSIKRPGQRLGDLFVEKAFQLAIRVPRLSPDDKSDYLDFLLSVKKPKDEVKEANIQNPQEKLDELLRNEVTDDGIFEKYEIALKNGIPKPLAQKVVLEKLSDRMVHESLEHALQPYARYLDPNPRSIKRLLNFYAIYRLIIFIEGKPVDRSRLVRWLILSMRWPILAEYLSENPEHTVWIGSKTVEELIKLEISTELQLLFNSQEVKDLINGDNKEKDRIDAKTIELYADLF